MALLALRAARFESRQVRVAAAPRVAVDVETVARRLAGGLRFPSVSHHDRSRMQAEPFLGLRAHLEASYPRLHRHLAREIVNAWSLLYTWPGSDPSLGPLLLMAHSDVVPVDEGSEAAWSHPPFAGRIAGGEVWGRGALDDKANLFCILEAVEGLLAEGFRPRRGVLLAFGHDEEVGGEDGALAIAELLGRRGVRPWMVLDEGGAIASGLLPGLDRPLALVTVAEKGSLNLELVVEGDGGHSSVPPRHTAVGVLAGAIHRLERSPMPSAIDGTTRATIEYLGPELDFWLRLPLANLWLFGAPLRALASWDPVFDALVRTTTAATVFEGGTKSNVLPTAARAVVNHRIHPRDSVDAVIAHVRARIDDERVPPRSQASAEGARSEPAKAKGRAAGERSRRQAGRSSSLPVVARLSRARCAAAASESGKRAPIRTRSSPRATAASTWPARSSSSARSAV